MKAPAHTSGKNGTTVVIGKSSAKKTLKIYEDARCPVCASFEQSVGPTLHKDVEAGKNIFCEKPVAVDGPGARMMYAAAEKSKQKHLKVAAGTQRRHAPVYRETIKRIQDGAIGDVTALRVYWVNGGPIWHRGDKGNTDLERQILRLDRR